MGHARGALFAAAASVAVLFGGSRALLAATSPEVKSVVVGRDEASGRAVVTLVGASLTKVTGFTLADASSTAVPGTVDLLLRSKSMLVAVLPAGVGGQEYSLTPLLKTGSLPVLHVKFEDGGLFGGVSGVGTIPATGAGVRMMWYPGKAAFRAGEAQGTEWDDASVGIDSFAAGYATTASGGNSVALGNASMASGYDAVALGDGNIASGFDAAAFGSGTTASGNVSTALGLATTASGNYSVSMGVTTIAQSLESVVLGRFNTATGDSTSWVATDPILVVGNGTNPNSRADAFSLLKNGNLTIAGTLTQNSDARLKRDIAPLSGVLARLAGIRGVTYRMKDESRGPAGPQIGLLAQEVRAAFPELVHEDAQGGLSVAYGNFSAVLLEAVREQDAALRARDAEVAALRRQLADERAATESRLRRLEAALLASGPPAGEGK